MTNAFRVYCVDCRNHPQHEQEARHHGGPFLFATKAEAEAFAEAQVWFAKVEDAGYQPFETADRQA